jgi:hypothetical protein
MLYDEERNSDLQDEIEDAREIWKPRDCKNRGAEIEAESLERIETSSQGQGR